MSDNGDGREETEIRVSDRGSIIGMVIAFIVFLGALWALIHIAHCDPGAGRSDPVDPEKYERQLFGRDAKR